VSGPSAFAPGSTWQRYTDMNRMSIELAIPIPHEPR
jgi:hypothetical protein